MKLQIIKIGFLEIICLFFLSYNSYSQKGQALNVNIKGSITNLSELGELVNDTTYLQIIKVPKKGIGDLVFISSELKKINYKSDFPKTYISNDSTFEFNNISLQQGKYFIALQSINNHLPGVITGDNNKALFFDLSMTNSDVNLNKVRLRIELSLKISTKETVAGEIYEIPINYLHYW